MATARRAGGITEAPHGGGRTRAVASAPIHAENPPATRTDAPPDTARATNPAYVAPGLVLLAAAAVYEGYRWLHLIPDGRMQPLAGVFAVGAAPAAAWLTRRVAGPGVRVTRAVARVAGVLVPVLWLLAVTTTAGAVWAALGVVSLVLAVASAVLAACTEADGRAGPPPL